MHKIVLVALACGLSAAAGYGQIQGTKAGTADALQKLQDQRNSLAEIKAEAKKNLESGQNLFGVNKRYTPEECAGTLAGKAAPDYKIGDWGRASGSVRVINKVSDTECLVQPKYKGSPVVLIRGLDMSKVTDGVEFILPHPVVIQESFSYTTVAGSKKTVFVLDADSRKVDVHVEQKRAEIAAAKAKADAAAKAVENAAQQKLDAAAEKRLQDLERVAVLKFTRAKALRAQGDKAKAIKELKQLVSDPDYAKTSPIEDAKKLLSELE